MIQYITSRKNKIVLDTIDLRKNKISNEKKLFVIEGEHLLEMALKANYVAYILTNKHLNNIDDHIDQYIVTDDILSKISVSKSAPNVIAVCRYIDSKINNTKNILYLDNVQDPGNVGTILRSSLAFSVFNVLLSDDSVSKYNEKVIQASQGSLFSLNIQTCNFKEIEQFKKIGYKVVVTVLSSESIKLNDFKFNDKDKYVLVVGNEGQGIRKDILSIADYRLFIEMKNIDSLNVGVATSIVLYKLSIDTNN
jgi:RNA methyltransferase, TrmH family